MSTEKPDPFDTSYVNAPSYNWNDVDNQQVFPSLSSRRFDTNTVAENFDDLYENVHSQSSISNAFDAGFSFDLKKKMNHAENVIPALKPFSPQLSYKSSISSSKNYPHRITPTLSTPTMSPIQLSYSPARLAKSCNVLTDSRQQQLQHPLGTRLASKGAESAINSVLPEMAESRFSADLNETDTLFTRLGISKVDNSSQNNFYKDTSCKYEKTPMHTELMRFPSTPSGNQTNFSYIFDQNRVNNEIKDNRSHCGSIIAPPTQSRSSINIDSRIYNNTQSGVIRADIRDDSHFHSVRTNETTGTSLVSRTNSGFDVNINSCSTADERIGNYNYSSNVYDAVPDNDNCDEIRSITYVNADNYATNSTNNRPREQSTCKNIYDSVSGDYQECTSYYDAVEDDSLSSAHLTTPSNAVSIDLF